MRPAGLRRCGNALLRLIGLQRDLGGDAGAAAGRALDREAAAERLDAVGETAQARALGRIGAADAVVGDPDDARPFSRATRTFTPVAPAYLITFASASAIT